MPHERWRRWQRIAIVVWTISLAVPILRPLLQPQRNSVYPIFAGAGRHWVAAGDLYVILPGENPYRYSPLIAAAFAPLAVLSDGVGGLVWRVICATVFLVGLAAWGRALAPVQRPLFFLLPVPLALGNLHNGQANILIIGLLLIAIVAVQSNRFNLASFCLVIACLFKIYPIAVALLLMLLYPRQLGWRLFVLLVVGALLPFVLQRPSYVAAQYAGWAHHLTDNDRQLMPRDLWYRDVRALWSSWISPMSYRAYQVLQGIAAAVIAGAVLAARRAGWPTARLLALILGLGCCWMTVLGPATESTTYVLLAPTVVWLLLSAKAERHPLGLRILWLTAYVLLLISQVVQPLPKEFARQVVSLEPQPLAALLLLGGQFYLVVAGVTSRRKSRTNERSHSSTLMTAPS